MELSGSDPLRQWDEAVRLRYLPGHSKGRRREVYAVESRHWAQLQKGPNKEEGKEETEEDKKGRGKEEEEFGSGEGQGEGEIKNKQRTKSIKSEKGTTGGKEKIQEMEKQKQGKQSLQMN